MKRTTILGKYSCWMPEGFLLDAHGFEIPVLVKTRPHTFSDYPGSVSPEEGKTYFATGILDEDGMVMDAEDSGVANCLDIPGLLKSVPLESIDAIADEGSIYTISMENIRDALEGCLQDHMFAHVVSIEGDKFVIEMMRDLLETGGQ